MTFPHGTFFKALYNFFPLFLWLCTQICNVYCVHIWVYSLRGSNSETSAVYTRHWLLIQSRLRQIICCSSLLLHLSPILASYVTNALTQHFPLYFPSPVTFQSASSALHSLFPSPHVNSCIGKVIQAPDKKNMTPKQGLLEWEPGKPQEMCMFAVSTRGILWPSVHTHDHSTTQAELWNGGDSALAAL